MLFASAICRRSGLSAYRKETDVKLIYDALTNPEKSEMARVYLLGKAAGVTDYLLSSAYGRVCSAGDDSYLSDKLESSNSTHEEKKALRAVLIAMGFAKGCGKCGSIYIEKFCKEEHECPGNMPVADNAVTFAKWIETGEGFRYFTADRKA